MNNPTLEKYLVARFFQERLHSLGSPAMDLNQIEGLLLAETSQQQAFLELMVDRALRQKWSEDFRRTQDLGICHTVFRDENYPRGFTRMEYPPLLFSFLGKPVWLEQPALAVVGGREITSLSTEWMEIHLANWVQAGLGIIVSGGARGVDQKAHELCLRYQVPTIAVIPSGIGQLYPSSLSSWISPIVSQGGAIVSEYAYEQEMRKHFFQARNRLISGFGVCTLIVQSARRSGTQLTARLTLEQGRTVLVIPSHPLELQHRGGLDLLLDGADPVRDAEDLKSIFSSEASLFVRRFPPIVDGEILTH